MNVPNLSAISTPDGKVHPEFVLMMSQLVTEMQNNLSNQGFKVPQQDSDTITKLNTQKSLGALLYDNQTHEFKVNINGTFKTVQVA